MPRKKLSLKQNAVPSIFPNCPSYLTDRRVKPPRLSREDKEMKSTQATYKESRIDFQETEAKFLVTCFTDIVFKLSLIDLLNGWILHKPNSDSIFMLKIHIVDNQSSIERSLIINQYLAIEALYKQKHPIQLSCSVVNDMRVRKYYSGDLNLNRENTKSKKYLIY